MDDMPETLPPVGRTRQIVGLIILVLGALILVRMAWLVVFYWPGFGRDEWIRFAFLHGVGAVLVLAGCWLRYQVRLAGWAAMSITLAFLGFLCISILSATSE